MSENEPKKRQPAYLGLVKIASREEAEAYFRAKYNREPKQVLPPDAQTPYWRVGPVGESETE